MRPKILLIADWYLPGYKAGGIVTALANLVDGIGDEVDLRVITRDRDLTDAAPHPCVVSDQWQPVGKASVFYTHNFSLSHLRHRIAEAQPDIVYLNSFFSPLSVKTLVLRKLPPSARRIRHRASGRVFARALRIKRRKKSLYAAAALRTGFYDRLLWHATSSPESAAIESFLRAHARQKPQIAIAPDLPNRAWFAPDANAAARAPKSAPVKFLFLSRICRMKNLQFILDALASLSAPAELHIYGPIDDQSYWDECQRGSRRFRAMSASHITAPCRANAYPLSFPRTISSCFPPKAKISATCSSNRSPPVAR